MDVFTDHSKRKTARSIEMIFYHSHVCLVSQLQHKGVKILPRSIFHLGLEAPEDC